MTGDLDDLFRRYGAGYRWLATVTVMMGTVTTVLTATIVNVAVPAIMADFGIGQDTAQWLATAFFASMTTTMLANAWAVHRAGQKATFVAALLVFLAGSLLGGFSPGPGWLIVARVLQGGAAGLIQPLAMVTIFSVFPHHARGSAIGIYGLGVILAPTVGPLLGGVLVDELSWRWVFFIAVPFCVAGILPGLVFMPGRSAGEPRRRFDWAGFLLLALALTSLLTALTWSQDLGWRSAYVLGPLSIALLAAPLFFLRQRLSAEPLLDLSLFRNPRFAAAASLTFLVGGGLYATMYLIPLLVQTLHGYTATEAGLLLMPAGLTMALLFPVSGRLADRISRRLLIITGLLLFAAFAFLMTGVGPLTPAWILAAWLVLGRIGLALISPAMNTSALHALGPELLAQGSGAMNFLRQLGGALGVNLLALALEQRARAELAGALPPGAEMLGLDRLAELQRLSPSSTLADNSTQAGPQNLEVFVDAYTAGFHETFLIVGLVYCLGVLPAWRLRGR